MNKENKGILINIIPYFMILTFIIIQTVLTGIALKIIWNWFIVDYFQIKELTIPVALGISVLFSLFKDIKVKRNPEKDSPASVVVIALIVPIIALGLGYVIHLFV